MNYQEWSQNWMEHYIMPSVKQRTYIRYSEIIRHHIIPRLGKMELREITPLVLQAFVTELLQNGNLHTGKGLSANSVNGVITVLQNSLKTAHSVGILEEYKADRIRRPKQNEKKIECFSLAEQKRIEEYILSKDKTNHFGILICLYTGLRIGELLALEWSDIDFSKCELTVNKTCYEGVDRSGKFTRITDMPKTVSSERTIPFPEQIVPILMKMKKRSCSTYVISNGREPVRIRSYQMTFQRLISNLGISRRGFHSLRHTFATRAIECGVDVKTLSEILGHKSPTITLNRYAHSLMDHKKEMMNKIGNLL